MEQKAKFISCPTCKKECLWSGENSWRPFCSERCKLIDLNDWFSESHTIPCEEIDDFQSEESIIPTDH